MNEEEIIFTLISYSGSARSFAMEAMSKARKGETKEANDLINKCSEELNKAHNLQTKLICEEAKGNKINFSLLLVHAQDHLMNSITMSDLGKQIIGLSLELQEIKLIIQK